MTKVWIMRGLPGSGKSTWIGNTLFTDKDQVTVSADSYHMVEGEYRYDPKNAGAAHDRCLLDFMRALTVPGPRFLPKSVVVDNTNTTAVELAPYVRIAQALGLEYEIVYLHCPVEVAVARNIHAVPATTILAMQANLLTEKLPFGWKQTVVFAEKENQC